MKIMSPQRPISLIGSIGPVSHEDIPRNPIRPRAFTLIEMLVAIAVLAILTTISAVVYSRVQEQGNKTRCLNNLKALHAALMAHAVDHNDRLPQGAGMDSNSNWVGWMHGILSYVDQDLDDLGTVWQCPSAKISYTQGGGRWNHSYSCHYELFGDGSAGFPGIPLSRISNPQELILLVDGCQNPSNGTATAVLYQPNEFKWGATYGATIPTPDIPISSTVGDADDGVAGSPRYRHSNDKIANYITVSGRAVSAVKNTIYHRAVVAQ